MPNRLLREGITTSEKIDALSGEAERFYYRLLVHVDDFGRQDARPAVLIAKTYPLRVDRVKPEHVEAWLAEFDSTGLAVIYENDGKRYVQLTNFDKPRARESKWPSPQAKGSVRKHLRTRENICEQPKANVPYSYSDSNSNSDSVQLAAPPAPLVLSPPKPRSPKKPKGHPDWTRTKEAFGAMFLAHHGAAPTWNGKSGEHLRALLSQHSSDEVLRRAAIMFSDDCPDWIRRGGRDMGALYSGFDRLASPAPPPKRPVVIDQDYRDSRAEAGFPIDPPPEPSPPASGAYQLPPADRSDYRRTRPA